MSRYTDNYKMIMRRRRFLRDLSLGSSGVLLAEQALADRNQKSTYSYGQITTLEEARTKEGLINIRLEFRASENPDIRASKGKISISKGKLSRLY